MLKKILFILTIYWCAATATAQTESESIKNITPEHLEQLKKEEFLLNKKFQAAMKHEMEVERVSANYDLIPELVRTLKTEGSFYYPLSGLEGMSILYAPDNKFRIFSWMIPLGDQQLDMIGVDSTDRNRLDGVPDNRILENTTYKYFGAIQMNSDSLKLIPLFDKSEEINQPEDQVLSNENWYGCVYYKIVEKELQGEKHYALLGWDGNNGNSNRKIMEILYFDANKKPVFGAPIIEVVRDDMPPVLKHRMFLQYKETVGVTLNYYTQQDQIVFDFLAPEDEKAKGNYEFYVPDGTYQALQFKGGLWKHIDRVFLETMQENQLNTNRPDQLDKNKKNKKRVKSKYAID